VNRSEAVAVGLWRVRLCQTLTRCLAVAEFSLAAAERLGRINRTVAAFGFSVQRMQGPSC
jgi:hypothetical protein